MRILNDFLTTAATTTASNGPFSINCDINCSLTIISVLVLLLCFCNCCGLLYCFIRCCGCDPIKKFPFNNDNTILKAHLISSQNDTAAPSLIESSSVSKPQTSPIVSSPQIHIKAEKRTPEMKLSNKQANTSFFTVEDSETEYSSAHISKNKKPVMRNNCPRLLPLSNNSNQTSSNVNFIKQESSNQDSNIAILQNNTQSGLTNSNPFSMDFIKNKYSYRTNNVDTDSQ